MVFNKDRKRYDEQMINEVFNPEDGNEKDFDNQLPEEELLDTEIYDDPAEAGVLQDNPAEPGTEDGAFIIKKLTQEFGIFKYIGKDFSYHVKIVFDGDGKVHLLKNVENEKSKMGQKDRGAIVGHIITNLLFGALNPGINENLNISNARLDDVKNLIERKLKNRS